MALTTLEEITVESTQKSPNVSFLTTKSIDGTGVFDVLMKTVKLHLMEEYEANRISEGEYSQVYLGALTAVMQQSVTYILNHQNEEKINAEVGLLRQQTITELANTDDTIPLNLGFNATQAVLGIVKGKKDIDALQASLVASQIATADAEEALTGQRIISELANTSTDISLARAEYGFNNENNLVSGLIAMQAAKIAKDGELVDAQISVSEVEKDLTGQKFITELANTGNDITLAKLSYGKNNDTSNVVEGLIKAQKDKYLKEGTLIDNQIETSAAEKALVGQKIVTELANTGDLLTSIPVGYGYNVEESVAGLIKLQKDKVAKESELVDSQIDSAAAEKILIHQKAITELANTSDGISTAAALIGLNDSNSIAGLVKAQLDKNDAEILLMEQKIASELAQTHDTIPAGLGAQDAGYTVAGMIQREKEKLAAETLLLNQKKSTEEAQIADAVWNNIDGTWVSGTIGGYLGKQIELLGAQKDGYKRDAEQKLSKILVDAWSVDRSMGDATATTTNFLDDTSLGAVLSTAIDGVTT